MEDKSVDLVEGSATRLRKAREIAANLRHDEKLHRLAMRAVFVLEDCHEAVLRRLADTPSVRS